MLINFVNLPLYALDQWNTRKSGLWLLVLIIIFVINNFEVMWYIVIIDSMDDIGTIKQRKLAFSTNLSDKSSSTCSTKILFEQLANKTNLIVLIVDFISFSSYMPRHVQAPRWLLGTMKWALHVTYSSKYMFSYATLKERDLSQGIGFKVSLFEEDYKQFVKLWCQINNLTKRMYL